MKIAIPFFVATLFICETHAQEPQTLSRTILKLSPQHFTDNSLKAGVERFNKTHSSSFVFLITGKLENYHDATYQYGYNGCAAELQFRKYVRPMKMNITKNGKVFHHGIYGAAYLQGGSYSGQFADYYYPNWDPNTSMPGVRFYYDYRATIGNFGFGLTMGYHRTLWEVIFLEAYLGGGIQFSDRTLSGITPDPDYLGTEGITDPAYRGIMPKIGVNIGLGL